MPWEKQFDVDEVLDSAMGMFWEQGYQATSMQQLVEHTGVNRASLYATYSDKRELFLAALRRYDERRRRMLSELEAGHKPKDAIRRLFLAFVDQAASANSNRGCFLTNTALELSAHDPDAGRIVARGQADVEAFFLRLIQKGKAAGDIPRHVRAAETARGLLAALLGLLVLVRSRPEPALLKSIVDDAMRRLA